MSPIRRTFYLSNVEIGVTCTLPEVQRGLAALWGGCARPLLPVTTHRDIIVGELDGGYEVRMDDGACVRVEDRLDVLAAVETQIYAHVVDWVGGHGKAVLHASAVTRDGATLLFVGPSGSGKSSLSLAALKRGFSYITDEMVITDGERLWGVPRAVQFDPVAAGSALPAWLEGADDRTYEFHDRDGVRKVTPFIPVGPQAPVAAPVPASGLHVVQLCRGEPSLTELAPVRALAALHEATHGEAQVDLGRLTAPKRCWSLTWSDGPSAMALLESRALEEPGTL